MSEKECIMFLTPTVVCSCLMVLTEPVYVQLVHVRNMKFFLESNWFGLLYLLWNPFQFDVEAFLKVSYVFLVVQPKNLLGCI